MHATVPALMFKSPRRYVSDGRFTPEGTVQFKHFVSIEGAEASFYADGDMVAAVPGLREQLDLGQGIPVEVTLNLGVNNNGKLQAFDLVRVVYDPKASSKAA